MKKIHGKIIRSAKGFTMLEIIVVLIIFGILAAVAASRFQDDSNAVPAVEAVKAHIRYAQSQAMNTGSLYGIQCSSGQLSLFRDNAATQIVLPGENGTSIDLSQRKVDSIDDFNIYFDNWGAPYSGIPVSLDSINELASPMTVNVNSGAYTFNIIDGTGYVK